MQKNKKINIMVSFLMILFSLFFVVISGRFIYIQATGEVSDVSLIDWAEDKRETSLVLSAERGKIFDNNGMTLAYNRPSYRVFAIIDPDYSNNLETTKHVVDTEKTA